MSARPESAFETELRERGLYNVAHAICLALSVLVDELHGALRYPSIVAARRLFALHLRTELGWSYPQIGRLLGRDHTTVMMLCRAAQKERAAAGNVVSLERKRLAR